MAKIPSLFHCDSSKKSRRKCHASHKGLGASFEEEIEPEVWAQTAFASRFLNNAEAIFSTNELELLAVVWACDHFRLHLLGNRFQVLTDHKAIISALNENYNNKSYQSRLSRRAEKLLPFDFEVINAPGVILGIAGYLSIYPTFSAPKPSNYDEIFFVKSLEAFNNALALINSSCLSKSRSGCSPPSQGGVDFTTRHRSLRSYQRSPVGGDGVNTQSLNQSNRVMLMIQSNFSSIEGDGLCSESVSQSKTSMLTKKT